MNDIAQPVKPDPDKYFFERPSSDRRLPKLPALADSEYCFVLYTNIDQTLVNTLHGLLNCEIGGLDCRVSTTEYKTRAHCIHM